MADTSTGDSGFFARKREKEIIDTVGLRVLLIELSELRKEKMTDIVKFYDLLIEIQYLVEIGKDDDARLLLQEKVWELAEEIEAFEKTEAK